MSRWQTGDEAQSAYLVTRVSNPEKLGETMRTLLKTPYLHGNPLVIALAVLFAVFDDLRGHFDINLGRLPMWFKRYYIGMVYYQIGEIGNPQWRQTRREVWYLWAYHSLHRKIESLYYRTALCWYNYRRLGWWGYAPVAGGITRVGPISPLFFQQQKGGLPAIVDKSIFSGNIFFVDDGTAQGGTTSGFGQHPDQAITDIDAAYDLCTASQGDTLIVLTGHAETITNSDRITMDVAGIDVRGLGRALAKPTITFGTDTTADIVMSAASNYLGNLRLVSDVNSLVNFLDIGVSDLEFEDLDFVTSSAKEAVTFVDIATTFDNYIFRRCTFLQPTDPAGTDGNAGTGCIHWVDTENILVEDCRFYGNFETAIFHNRTTAGKNLWVNNCHGIQNLSGAEPFQLVDGQTGGMVGGGFVTPAETAAVEATLVGTVGAGFFVLPPGSFGNDGAAGGQGGIVVATPS